MMKSCLLLSLMLAAAASGSIVEKRILGGKSCKKERDYDVKVSWDDGQTPCGGSLLNIRWVLTAARCGNHKLKVSIPAEGYFGFFSGSQKIDVKQQYFFSDSKNTHDIMLIKLNKEASAEHAIELPEATEMAHPPQEAAPEEAASEEAAPEEAAPEELEKRGLSTPPLVKHCSSPANNKKVQIGGWGDGGKNKKILCTEAKITSCKDGDKKVKQHAPTLMCAHSPGVKSCSGDAGSGVVYDKKLHGIIVNNRADACANIVEILDICFYLDWIMKTMRDHS